MGASSLIRHDVANHKGSNGFAYFTDNAGVGLEHCLGRGTREGLSVRFVDILDAGLDLWLRKITAITMATSSMRHHGGNI